MDWKKEIFAVESEDHFQEIALSIFHHQKQHCKVYRDFIHYLSRPTPKKIEEIPFLPISFFKTHTVVSNQQKIQTTFKSSGTGGDRSSHHVTDISLYQQSFQISYDHFMGTHKNQVILALLPNYLEQGESSLVYMVDQLIKEANPLSAFVLNDLTEVIERYNKAIELNKEVVIFGVSYALLDLCKLTPDLSEATVIETGGMKGRRKELTKQELHNTLKAGLNCQSISSEYGMTELLSQAYSNQNGIFQTPPWMKILIRQVNDPFKYQHDKKTGGINIIDLANINSCSFIASQDLGKLHNDGFEIMGRFDHSDIRGCNLLFQ
ncbi:MAG: acyl transferase [Crocinitomicaceae bacterium]|nr:acyl transferase [Crocinitomicaceae bacterium]